MGLKSEFCEGQIRGIHALLLCEALLAGPALMAGPKCFLRFLGRIWKNPTYFLVPPSRWQWLGQMDDGVASVLTVVTGFQSYRKGQKPESFLFKERHVFPSLVEHGLFPPSPLAVNCGGLVFRKVGAV